MRRERFKERLHVIDRKLKTQWAPVMPGTLVINGIMAMDPDVNWETGEITKSGAMPGDWLEYEAEI